MRTAALNRRDWWIWTAEDYGPLPVTLGSDGAGTVGAIVAEVSDLAVGEEVVFDPTLGWGDSGGASDSGVRHPGGPRPRARLPSAS
jgi:zinc-binding alcohol dehydrogenase/oxidoreductase